ncbi:MAG: hypothetical protein C4K49_04630 [Candidatus Thorarchaeota archaeon]|nr:MAG: hypothetical protein C4K49_04630 [Candidatus Thorarchaeota archaeon]
MSTPELDKLRDKCRDAALDKGSHVLILSSPAPESTLPSALLGRSIMKSGGIFHITFTEPVLNIEALGAVIKAHSRRVPIVIGIDIVGNQVTELGENTPILLGGSLDQRCSSYPHLGLGKGVSIAAYALAQEKLDVGPEELFLAAAGSLLENSSINEADRQSRSLVKLALESGVLEEERGFRIFGVSFLPLTETLSNSISPYLPGVSGVPESCEALLDDADIAPQKRDAPIALLASEEKKRLTERLVPKLGKSVIRRLLGLDFETGLEPVDGPLRRVSGVQALAEAAWCRQDLGTAQALWIGDRARMLRSALDSYRVHCRGVISGVQHLVLAQKNREVENVSSHLLAVPLIEARSETLSDVGRIAFESGYVDQDVLLVLYKDDCAGVIWYFDSMSLSKVILALTSAGLAVTSTSARSVLVSLSSKEDRIALFGMLDKLVKAGD